MSDEGIVVSPALIIPASELTFRASRAGGPGGQHVNTSSTRIELLWDLTNSKVVTDEVRARLLEKLAARLDASGMVRVVASDRRSQAQNRDAAAERLAKIVKQALVVPRKRRKTRPTVASREQRLSDKRRQRDRKRERRRDFEE
ncbi:MAG TPA: alternative ribosome rescue aminoacyl-tRNA hydrolase ArfB [Gemmatimonadaceae bacterium]|jgi:ribosome-associated protein